MMKSNKGPFGSGSLNGSPRSCLQSLSEGKACMVKGSSSEVTALWGRSWSERRAMVMAKAFMPW